VFSISDRWKQISARRIERDDIRSLEETFGHTLEQLQALFAKGPVDLANAALPAYPAAVFNGGMGLNAFGAVLDIESSQFPRFLNLVRTSGEENGWLCVRRETAAYVTCTLLRTESRFRGVSVKMLTNDHELLVAIVQDRFNPAPPWIAMYEHGPFLHLPQGEPEYWLEYLWSPYWRSLSLDEQKEFVKSARKDTQAYISDDDWRDWLIDLRMRDPRTRDLDDEALARLGWF
jgi:hypothetical protein